MTTTKTTIICNDQAITVDHDESNGVTYYTTERRGVIYMTFFCKTYHRWFLSTTRKALGPGHIGGGRYYNDLPALAAGCKAFADLPFIIDGQQAEIRKAA